MKSLKGEVALSSELKERRDKTDEKLQKVGKVHSFYHKRRRKAFEEASKDKISRHCDEVEIGEKEGMEFLSEISLQRVEAEVNEKHETIQMRQKKLLLIKQSTSLSQELIDIEKNKDDLKAHLLDLKAKFDVATHKLSDARKLKELKCAELEQIKEKILSLEQEEKENFFVDDARLFGDL